MPQIGSYTLHTVETGRLGLDGGAMFGIVPRPLWERRIEPDERNRIPLNMRCLLIEGEGRLMLIDNGLGDKYNDKFADIYAVDHESAELNRSLNALGFSAEDVTDVIITHLHFDHCGGSTKRTAGGELELVFSNAVHHVQKGHWEWAKVSNVRERNSFLKENLAPLDASGQLNLIDGQHDMAPGIELLTADGHTEKMQLVKISDANQTLVFTADLIPTHAHIPIAWNMAYDVRPMQTIKEKGAFLEEACAGRWNLFFEHDPHVEVVSLTKTDRGITFEHPRRLSDM